ncbi:MAG: hypothetical protein ACYDFU_00035, partial [Nitrospirota bacterium]
GAAGVFGMKMPAMRRRKVSVPKVTANLVFVLFDRCVRMAISVPNIKKPQIIKMAITTYVTISPLFDSLSSRWIPAFAGMTCIYFVVPTEVEGPTFDFNSKVDSSAALGMTAMTGAMNCAPTIIS